MQNKNIYIFLSYFVESAKNNFSILHFVQKFPKKNCQGFLRQTFDFEVEFRVVLQWNQSQCGLGRASAFPGNRHIGHFQTPALTTSTFLRLTSRQQCLMSDVWKLNEKMWQLSKHPHYHILLPDIRNIGCFQTFGSTNFEFNISFVYNRHVFCMQNSDQLYRNNTVANILHSVQ